MSIFSTNQARQFYVATASTKDSQSGKYSAPDALGEIAVVKTAEGAYIQHFGKAGLTRSDLITNIISANVTPAAKMTKTLKSYTVTINNDPVANEDYILKVAFRQFVNAADDSIYTKFGMVHATSGMTKSAFYKELALSLAKNFSREASNLVKIKIKTSSASTEVTANTELTGTAYTGVIIEEVEQEWTLGVLPRVPVYFDVLAGDWGNVVKGTAGTLNNGKDIADLEYFCMGERGDIYRGVGYPNNIKTEYMVNSDSAYAVLDIHYAYVGANEGVQKSEKILTIVSTTESILNEIKAAIA